MSELPALLEAGKDEPADDGLRLILSDWVDEHDEAGRAEFIRAQLAVARYGSCLLLGEAPLTPNPSPQRGEGRKTKPPHPQPLSPEAGERGGRTGARRRLRV
jgi:uncharacterized protein (TIGR02996 family)